MANLWVFVCVFLASSTLSAKLPSSFTKCDRKSSDFDECLLKAIENAISQLSKPIREVGLPSMEPLEIPELSIGAGSGPAAFKQDYKNLKVSGYTKAKCSKAEFNSAEKKLSVQCKVPQLDMNFDYEVSGRILVLPIHGKGPGLIILDKLAINPTFDLEEYEQKGEKYYKVKSYKLELIPEKIRFKLDNLFDGDKVLGDNINQVMNDNWKEVFGDVKPSYEDAFGKIFTSIFNNLLGKVPVKNLFGDE